MKGFPPIFFSYRPVDSSTFVALVAYFLIEPKVESLKLACEFHSESPFPAHSTLESVNGKPGTRSGSLLGTRSRAWRLEKFIDGKKVLRALEKIWQHMK